jgi:membrane associated rhomboid family serine protease
MRRTPALVVIVGLNLVVFLLWQQAGEENQSLLFFMASNFLVSTAHVLHGHVWTLITAAFSHQLVLHLAINMFVLWSFGTLLEQLWGTRLFTVFYLSTAVAASVCHCLVSSLLMGSDNISALGASGAVCALLLAYALTFPRHKILLLGIVPVPALAGVLAFVGIDLWGLAAQTRGGGLPIGHGAHLGGALAGAIWYFGYLRSNVRLPPAREPAAAPAEAYLSSEEVHEFERIRRKVEKLGPQALTPKEQDFLNRLRERVMQAHESPEA